MGVAASERKSNNIQNPAMMSILRGWNGSIGRIAEGVVVLDRIVDNVVVLGRIKGVAYIK